VGYPWEIDGFVRIEAGLGIVLLIVNADHPRLFQRIDDFDVC
jgi:hypothetical protein